MTFPNVDEQQVVAQVHQAVEAHGHLQEELIPILFDINEQVGYIPTLAMVEVSKALRLPVSRVFSVATFYKMFATEPRGRHVIQFCESAPCHVMGGRGVYQAIKDTLELKPGQTSQDGKWTLVTTSCLGVCGVGPVIIIDDDLHGNLTPENLAEILGRYE